MLVGLPSFYGAWLHYACGLTQHAGLAEDVLDHRLNCRTVYMNPIVRFIYWNMNYHVEHHMFPLVPYHALPALHEELKPDMPPPYRGFVETYREIIPTLIRQAKDPQGLCQAAASRLRLWLAPAELTRCQRNSLRSGDSRMPGNWVEACAVGDVDEEDVIAFDHGGRTYAIYHSPDGDFYATDGLCTHEDFPLADGLVMDNIIECAKHNGRFDYRTGEAKGAPVCVNLKTYPVKVEAGKVLIDLG